MRWLAVIAAVLAFGYCGSLVNEIERIRTAATATPETPALPIPPEAFAITSTNPADGSAPGVIKSISITFNRELEITSLTQGTSDNCVGSIQVSVNDFSSCVAMSDEILPTLSADKKTITLRVSGALSPVLHKIRATTGVIAADGSSLQNIFTHSTGFTPTAALWAQEAYVKAPNAEAGDAFGWSVAISADTLVVGTYSEDSNQTTITNGTTASGSNAAINSGAVYVFKRTGSFWMQEAYLKAPNAEANDEFGYSVAISGDTIAVGANQEDSNQTTITNGSTASIDNSIVAAGAVYVFKRNAGVWSQQAYLKTPNPDAGDQFGISVAISGSTIAVGSIYESSNQITITNGSTASGNNSTPQSGAVYVFKRSGANWAQEAYIKAPNAEANDHFGASISLSGDRLAVGAPQEDSNQVTITNGFTASADNSATDSGAVYVFKRSVANWAQEAYVKPTNADSLDAFGSSVATTSDTLVVGVPQESSNQTTITNGPTASANNSAAASGAVYVFKRNGNNWTQDAYLKAPNAEASDQFGFSVAISGDTIVAGANQEDSNQITITNGATASGNNSAAQAGAAYVFKRSGGIWAQEAYLKPPNAESNDSFGRSVNVSGDTVVVGASQESSNQITITNGTTASANNSALNAGAAYIFRLQ